MKLTFNKLFIFVFFLIAVTSPLYAKKFESAYLIEVGKIDIGKLHWKIEISDNKYKITIDLKDRGFWTSFYKFKGTYVAEGFIQENKLLTNSYKQSWETKNKRRLVEINFENKKISNLKMRPEETELARVDFFKFEDHLDPLSSFVSILMDNNQSKTIDGRRVYTMSVVEQKVDGEYFVKKIKIENYKNIWADHKRNDLRFIEYKTKKTEVFQMPLTLKIKYKNLNFNLNKI